MDLIEWKKSSFDGKVYSVYRNVKREAKEKYVFWETALMTKSSRKKRDSEWSFICRTRNFHQKKLTSFISKDGESNSLANTTTATEFWQFMNILIMAILKVNSSKWFRQAQATRWKCVLRTKDCLKNMLMMRYWWFWRDAKRLKTHETREFGWMLSNPKKSKPSWLFHFRHIVYSYGNFSESFV